MPTPLPSSAIGATRNHDRGVQLRHRACRADWCFRDPLLLGDHGAADGHDEGDAVDALNRLVLGRLDCADGVLANGYGSHPAGQTKIIWYETYGCSWATMARPMAI
jgi:hypothetical protein